MEWLSGVKQQFVFNIIEGERYKMLLSGLEITVVVALGAAVLGVILGCFVALMRISKSKVLNGIASVYVDVIRGTPAVVQLMIMYYVIMCTYAGPKEIIAILSFGINSGAYVSEMIRGGILAVDAGQTEAGRSLGLSAGATMRLIVLPQAFKISLPSLFNEFISLLKETSVCGFIGLMDLTKAGDYIRSRTYSAFFPLITVAVIYLIIVIGLTRLFEAIEKGVRQGDSH